MLPSRFVLIALGCVTAAAVPAQAETIDILQGQFAFNWASDPSKTRCAKVDDTQLAAFKSDAFTCDLKIITNTASGEPARVCTQKTGGKAEYLIFATKKSCETEREVQVSNGD